MRVLSLMVVACFSLSACSHCPVGCDRIRTCLQATDDDWVCPDLPNCSVNPDCVERCVNEATCEEIRAATQGDAQNNFTGCVRVCGVG